MPRLSGVICPMLTPFDPGGSIYREGVRNMVEFLSSKRVDGLFVCGTFGLGPAMTLDERKKTVEYVMDSAKESLEVIVQVGSTNLEYSLELARHAEDCGADAVASTPPFYYVHSDDTVLAFYRELVFKLGIPVLAYNIPSRVGYWISPELLEKIVEAGVSGMKDSGNDVARSYEYMASAKRKRPDFKFLIGTEALALPALIAGADGVVSGLSNVYPEVVVKLYDHVRCGRLSEAVELQFKIVKARRVVESGSAVQLCYELLRARGVDAGYPKPLFERVGEREVEAALRRLDSIGLLDEL